MEFGPAICPPHTCKYPTAKIGPFNAKLYFFRNMFQRVLFYKDYGYVNLVDMCIALKHIFHYIRPGHDDFKLFDKSKPFPQSAEKHWTISSSGQAAKVNSILDFLS